MFDNIDNQILHAFHFPGKNVVKVKTMKSYLGWMKIIFKNTGEVEIYELSEIIKFESEPHQKKTTFIVVCKKHIHYLKVSVLIHFSQKDNIIKVFYLNYIQFSIKSYVVNVY